MNLSSIFRMVILSSIIGSVLAIIIFIIKGLFKTKLNATWQYYIWFLVIVRLVIPAGFQTPLSKFNMLAFNTERIQVSQNLPKVTANYVKSNTKISEIKSDDKDNLEKTKVKDFYYYFNISSIVWAIVAIFAALIILSINTVLFFKVNKQPFCKDTDTIKVFKKCKSIMNISRCIPIVCDRHINTPSLFGVISPKILIDLNLVYKLSPEEKKYIFLHELSHFKKKDIVINWIILFCTILNWFNPIIWFAFRRMREDCEIACDAYVLSYLEKKEQIEYGKAIINLLKFVSDTKWIIGTTAVISGKSNIKRRIIMIKNFKKSPYKWTAVPICISLALVMIGVTNSPIKATALKNGGNLSETKQNDINYVNIIKEFLPPNSQIVTLSSTNGETTEEDNILLKDLDNDGENEIITAYKIAGEDEKVNILILKKVRENWIRALDESGEGFKLDLALTADIDGDGQNEVLLSRRIGGTVGQLFTYKWNNNLLNKISNEGLYYSKLDIVDVPGKNIRAVATWQHDTGDAYMIDILKWNGKTFVPDENPYPDYFKQSVVPYYEQKVKEMPNAGFYWYYLADAQIKAGDKTSALNSIEKGLELRLDASYPPKEAFDELKEKASK